jgi:hypothetical protein
MAFLGMAWGRVWVPEKKVWADLAIRFGHSIPPYWFRQVRLLLEAKILSF